MTKDDSNLKSTLKELETAFSEWDKLTTPGAGDAQTTEVDADPIKDQTKSMLSKLKEQIEELS